MGKIPLRALAILDTKGTYANIRSTSANPTPASTEVLVRIWLTDTNAFAKLVHRERIAKSTSMSATAILAGTTLNV